MKNTDAGFSVGLIDENDFFKWSVCFTGPDETIYEVRVILTLGWFLQSNIDFSARLPSESS